MITLLQRLVCSLLVFLSNQVISNLLFYRWYLSRESFEPSLLFTTLLLKKILKSSLQFNLMLN